MICVRVVAVTLGEGRSLKQSDAGFAKTVIKNVINNDLIVSKNSNRPIDLFEIVVIKYMIRSGAHRGALAVVVVVSVKPNCRCFDFAVAFVLIQKSVVANSRAHYYGVIIRDAIRELPVLETMIAIRASRRILKIVILYNWPKWC